MGCRFLSGIDGVKKMVMTKQVSLNEIERLIEFDFVRATESAALNTFHWLGKGDPLSAHAAAVDAIRGTLDVTSVIGTVLLGDGMNPQEDGIQENEILGTGEEDSLAVQLAILPIDGVELVGRCDLVIVGVGD